MPLDDIENKNSEDDLTVKVIDLESGRKASSYAATKLLLRSPLFLRIAIIVSVIFLALLVISDTFPIARQNAENLFFKPAPIPASAIYIGASSDNVYALRNSNGTLLWHFQTSGTLLTPSIVNNNSVYFGANDGSIYALRISDGTMLWHYKTSSVVASIVVDHTTAYVVDAYPDNIFAFQADTGKLLWVYHTQGDVPASLVIVNDIIYSATSPASNIYQTTTPPGIVYALRADNGKQLWQHQIPNSIPQQVFVDHNTVYVNSTFPGVLYALQADNGSLRWHFQTDTISTPSITSPFDTSFIMVNNKVYFCSVYGILYALRAEDGAVLWHYNVSLSGAVQFIANHGNIFILNTDSDNSPFPHGAVYVFRESDDTLLWHNIAIHLTHSALVTNNVLYIGSQDGYITALRTNNGSMLWQRTFTAFSSLSASNGNIYINTQNGSNITTYALRIGDDTVLWHYTITGQPIGMT